MITCGLSANHCIGQVQPGNSGHSNWVNEKNLIKALFRKLRAKLKEVCEGVVLDIGQKL